MFKIQPKFAEFPGPIDASNSEAEIEDGRGSDENESVDMVEDTDKNKDNSNMRTFYTEKYILKYQWLAYSYPKRGYICKLCEQFW